MLVGSKLGPHQFQDFSTSNSTLNIMRAALFLVSLAGYASALSLWTRQSSPPACTNLCLNTDTNNISTGSCAATNLECLCSSQPYVQAVINCMAIVRDGSRYIYFTL
jgi:hypothetical protein